MCKLLAIVDDEFDNWEWYIIFDGIMTGIASLLFLSISFMTYRFIRVFGTTQKLQLFFLVMTGVTMIGKIIYFATETAWRLNHWLYLPPVWIEDSIFWFSDTSFSFAVVGNIFHWIFVRIRITKDPGPKQDFLYKLASIGFVISISLVGFIYLGILIQAWAFGQDDTRGSRVFILIYAVLFLFIASIYSFAATTFYRSLKKVNKERAQNMKWRIILSIIFISMSFVLRGVLTLIQYGFNIIDEIRIDAIKSESWLLIGLLFITYMVMDLVPIAYLCWSIRVVENQKNDEIITDIHMNIASLSGPLNPDKINNSDDGSTSSEGEGSSESSEGESGDSENSLN